MPLFLRTREPMRQEKLILGGAITYRPRRHRFHSQRFPVKTHHKVVKPVVKAPAGTSKPVRRRGVATQRGRHRRLPIKKQHRTPLSQRRQQQQQQPVSQARRRNVSARHLSRKAMGKKRSPPTIANAAATSAKQVLKQLAKSRQIQRAVKGVVADVNLPLTGKKLVNRAVSSAVNISRKRPIEEMLEEQQQQQQQSPAKRARFQSSGYSSIGYRGKKIQRGGTKQQLGGGGFLF